MMLQEALASPLPALVPPPSFVAPPQQAPAAPAGSGARVISSPAPTGTIRAPVSFQQQQPALSLRSPAPAAPQVPAAPVGSEPFDAPVSQILHPQSALALRPVRAAASTATSYITCGIPLGLLAVVYLGYAALLASVSLAAPDFVLQGAVLASPLLSLNLGLHALALSGPLPVYALAFLCAAGLPFVLWLGRPLVMWALCLLLSLFFTSSMPRSFMRSAAVASTAVVVAALPLFFVPFAPRPVVWGVLLATLSIQSVVVTGRLRGQRILCSVGEDTF